MAAKKHHLSIFIKDMEPLVVQSEASKPDMLVMLLTALHLNSSEFPDEVIFLELHDRKKSTIFFQRSRLVSVQSSPPPGPEVLDRVKQNITRVAQQIPGPQAADPVLTAGFYAPNLLRLDTKNAEIYTLDNFLNKAECKKIIALMRQDLEPSRIVEEADKQLSEHRTSSTCYFHDRKKKHVFATEIEQRIARLMGLHPSMFEGLQGQYYEVGQEFKGHMDAFQNNVPLFDKEIEARGNRTWTVMVYLNEDVEGGETEFNRLGLRVPPKQGMALIWNNLLQNGEPNQDTMHQGLPVKKGRKAILNLWFRQRGDGSPVHTKSECDYVPNFTRDGIKKTRIPAKLFRELQEYYQAYKNNKDMIVSEDSSAQVSDSKKGGSASEVITLSEQMRDHIHRSLQSVCEKWSNQNLQPTMVYGIRRYKKNAQLPVHTDRPHTHIISAILCLDMNKGQKWPLYVEDNYYRSHHILMEPGDMLLYEGARCRHGRPTPLTGSFHCNLYVHYKPENFQLPNMDQALLK